MTGITSPALLEAFGRVPREQFLRSGPWCVSGRPVPGQKQVGEREVSEPAELYRDVSVLLVWSRNLYNGAAGTLAPWIDALKISAVSSVFHLGCGTGYYTAVMAEVVGPSGRVTAVETDHVLAEQARWNLESWPNIEVIDGDGGAIDPGPQDAVLVNAGVSHPATN